ncbi:glycoside hydrolase family 15 protein [Jatrophihabitans telluris]|uniref:Glycoside hydrolase family 15 protein n=1 Tax=Jatrophihabitans telluris TaxID=2038343 RepID=A0ABY4QX09_9ACTN|nr:glycoside hydrolase family 15 protein [Jatrophihabitans telluris]UQX87450.1 glycoside hydrolase family 15 protein [Jatrophihabitans telluris]
MSVAGLGRAGPGRRDGAGYIDIAEYAAIGDGRTVALIASDGRIDWLPLPDLDSVPAFAAVLDAADGGFMSLAPVGPYTVQRSYVEGTNVLCTVYRTPSGQARVTDSMNTGVAGRLPWAELVRRLSGLSGSVEFEATVRPGTCLNTASPWLEPGPETTLIRLDGLTMSVQSRGHDHIERDDREVRFRFRSEVGVDHLIGLVATEREPLQVPSLQALDEGVDRTIANWQDWSSAFHWDGEWSGPVHRSALALKLLIHAPTGAIAAAATTSLPEDPSGGKNWDYRYAWVRDMAYSLKALFRFGLREETHSAISWLLATIREHGPDPAVFYQLDGTPSHERTEPDVPGWRGIGPVVTGNRAVSQLQLGVYGDLLDIVARYVDAGNVLDTETARQLEAVADLACDRWRRPDAGMWELPEERHYVTSKLGCWQALVTAVRLCEQGHLAADPSRWRAEAVRIRQWVDEHGWSEQRQAYRWYPGTDELDASILLHAISGFDRGERMSRTLDALQDELGSGPHLFRYSGMHHEEGSFVACSFWMVSALHLCGRSEQARQRFEELLASSNEVGLFAEMLTPADGAFLGNFPQALSLLALINAAITLSEDPKEVS